MMPKPKKESRIGTTSTIQCCHYCVPPKRHTACWGHCPEYVAEKAEYERRKSEGDSRRAVRNAIYNQRADNVTKALRKRGR